MPLVVLPHSTIRQENPARRRTWGERLGFVAFAFVRGVTAFGGRLAALSGFVGGSVLTYLLLVVHLSLPWALVAVLAVVLAIFVMGAYQLWDAADQAAWRFAPTWEQCQLRADTLRALTEEFTYADQTSPPVEPRAVATQRRQQFRRQYMAGHMAATKADFDRASAAGYVPDFDREGIGSAQLEDVVELTAALEAVAQRWRADADAGTWRGPT